MYRGDGLSIGAVTPAAIVGKEQQGKRAMAAQRVVRDFKPGDQASVRELIQEGLRSRWGTSFDPAANPDTDDLATNYSASGAEIVVVEVNGRVAATGILSIEPRPSFLTSLSGPRIARLRRISVSNRHRRQGLGRLVVDELVRRATDRGYSTVVVSTDTPWTDAIALYQSCGFNEVFRDDEETHLVRVTKAGAQHER